MSVTVSGMKLSSYNKLEHLPYFPFQNNLTPTQLGLVTHESRKWKWLKQIYTPEHAHVFLCTLSLAVNRCSSPESSALSFSIKTLLSKDSQGNDDRVIPEVLI